MAKSTRGGRGATGNGETAAASAKATTDAGSAVAAGLQDIAQAWVDYAQQVMDRGVQAELMRGHLQAFLDQSTKLAEITNRMAARSIDAIGEAAGQARADKNRR
jgi:hypothetical protein